MLLTLLNSVFVNKFQKLYQLWNPQVLEKCPEQRSTLKKVRFVWYVVWQFWQLFFTSNYSSDNNQNNSWHLFGRLVRHHISTLHVLALKPSPHIVKKHKKTNIIPILQVKNMTHQNKELAQGYRANKWQNQKSIPVIQLQNPTSMAVLLAGCRMDDWSQRHVPVGVYLWG